MIKHRVTLKGGSVESCKISGLALKELLDVLTEGTRGALRLQVEGRSFAPGASPKWLDEAADFQITGLGKGSTIIDVETCSLAEAVPDKFQQLNLFRDHTTSAFSLFERSLMDAVKGKKDSELYDELLLSRYAKFGSLLGKGIDSIQLSNGKAGSPVVHIRKRELSKLADLQALTPRPQAVRISGRLETIRYSDKMFELITACGDRVRAVASAPFLHSKLTDLFGKDVTVEGVLVYRPSGSPLRIDASLVELSRDVDKTVWESLPLPGSQKQQFVEFHQTQGPKSGLNRIWGEWPGDETDEQVREALEAL